MTLAIPESEAKDDRAASNVDSLADRIEEIMRLAEAEQDASEQTPSELIDALNIAWICAERWRIERSKMLMQKLNEPRRRQRRSGKS